VTDNQFLDLAIEAVLNAGAIQLAYLDAGFSVGAKGIADVVTNVDVEIETKFRETIATRVPGHGVMAEEMSEALGDGTHRWLFDPIDGTANYVHGVPFFCSSVALEIDGHLEIGAVYEPVRRELFTAERGRGAFRNRQPIAVSKTRCLNDAMMGTGYPHGSTSRDRAMENLLAECAIRARGLRRLGSAALDLCYVACGRLDGFWDHNLKAWDTAAGALIVAEAGGMVTGLTGTPFDCYRGSVLASNGHLHRDIIDLQRRHG